MNILVISSYYPSLTNPISGIFVHKQVQELVKNGCQVRVIAPVPLAPSPLPLLSKKWRGYQATPRSDLLEGVQVTYPRYLSLPRNWFFGRSGEWMYAAIKNLVGDLAREFPLDLIHAHAALPAGYAAMRIAAKAEIPYLVTIHGSDLQGTIHLNRRCKQAVGQVISGSAAAVFVSEKLRRIARDQFGNREKYTVIPNGVDPEAIDQNAYSQLDSDLTQKTLLSVSNLFPSKGIEYNLSALARLTGKYPEVKYLIIGDGPERGHLENLSRELGISKQVEFLGQLPHQQVMSYMAACDIFSLPSWQEGFGIVYLEAMAHGVPVIGCQGEGIEDFVEDSVTGYLVKPRDLDDLVNVLDNLLENPQIRTQIGTNARKHVLENYTWEGNAQRTIQLYREIITDL